MVSRIVYVIKVTYVLLLFLTACSDDSNSLDSPSYASLLIDSEPSGAEIFLLGTNTGFVTPHKFNELEPGEYTITLRHSNFNDTSFQTIVHTDLLTTEIIKLFLPLEVFISHSIIDTCAYSFAHPC